MMGATWDDIGFYVGVGLIIAGALWFAWKILTR